MKISSWVLDPFTNANTTKSSNLEVERIGLTIIEEIKRIGSRYWEFWVQTKNFSTWQI